MAHDVSERNDQRRKEALATLPGRGYTVVEEAPMSVSLGHEARARCIDLYVLHKAAPTPGEMMSVSWLEQPSGVDVPTAVQTACEFFALRSNELERTMPDGRIVKTYRVPEDALVAKDRQGNPSFVILKPRIVSERSVLVKERCDFMPQVAPHPLEDEAPLAVIAAAALPPSIELVVEQEELEMKCTESTY